MRTSGRTARFGSRAVRITLAAVMASAGLVGFSAAPAAALPSSCAVGNFNGWGGATSVKCDAGYGYYQAVAVCGRSLNGNLWLIKKSVWWWVGSAQFAVASCPQDFPWHVNGWHNLRDS